MELFGEQRSATKDNVERRLARTAEELQEEEMEETVISDDEDDEEKVLYNPKNIPLGWDGKVGASDTLTEARQARKIGDNHANCVSLPWSSIVTHCSPSLTGCTSCMV